MSGRKATSLFIVILTNTRNEQSCSKDVFFINVNLLGIRRRHTKKQFKMVESACLFFSGGAGGLGIDRNPR